MSRFLASKYTHLFCIDAHRKTGFTKGRQYRVIRNFQSGTMFIYDVINDDGKVTTVEMTGVLTQFMGVLEN